MKECFLQVKGISKSFGGAAALKNVELSVQTGEVLCLAGENGSGKSTLIKIISGVHRADCGILAIEGKQYSNLTPLESIKLGIQVIYQDFSIFPNLTVAENIALNGEIQQGKRLVNWKNVYATAQEALDKVGVSLDLNLRAERLSIANKQLIAICRALLNDAKLIIMDEPTTALTGKETERLFDIIRGLSQKNIAVLIVNHKLEEVYDIADRIVILRNGENAAEGPICEFDRARFVQCMTGRSIIEKPYRPANKAEPIIFKAESLSRPGAFEDVSFSMRNKDIIGITGLLGSGRSELGEALFGIAPAVTGNITLDGKKLRIKSVKDAIENRIAYVPEDRLTQGLFLPKSIGINIAISSLNRYIKNGYVNSRAMQKDIGKWITALSVNTQNSELPVQTLSGGNQQKVVIAKWINSSPRLLILNGPTVGVDIGSKADIHEILKSLAQQGMGVIIISDDLPELVANCNKVLIMRGGRLAAIYEDDDIQEDSLSAMITKSIELKGSAL